MQKVPADWTSRSEAQPGHLQAIVVASGFPPSIAGAHCCAECKIWASLIKKDVWPPNSHRVSALLWTMKGSSKFEDHCAIQEPTCLCNKRTWEHSSVLTRECESSGPILTQFYWALDESRHGPKVGRPGAESEQGAEAPFPSVPQVIHLGTGLPASEGRDTLS